MLIFLVSCRNADDVFYASANNIEQLKQIWDMIRWDDDDGDDGTRGI